MKNITYVLVSFLAGIMILAMSTFTVDQREYAIVFRLGEIISIKKEPGLYFKTPLIENVKFFDNRILTLNCKSLIVLSRAKRKTYLLIHSLNGKLSTLQNIMYL